MLTATRSITHRTVEVGELEVHVAESGTGPLVILLHGFPECWYSWRHQLLALADAGYHAVAPDSRGFARTRGPATRDHVTVLDLVGDVVGLARRFGAERFAVVGHDWGAPIAWATAQLRPDLVSGVAGLSVPPAVRGSRPTLTARREALGDAFYQVYFQRPGVAEAELGRDLPATFRSLLHAGSGHGATDAGPAPWRVGTTGGLLAALPDPGVVPPWLTEQDLQVFVDEYARAEHGPFHGGLNYYRNLDRNWHLTAAFAGMVIRPPAAFVTGDRDLVRAFPGMASDPVSLAAVAPDLRSHVVLPGCGHWTQQERPDEVNAILVDFLDSLTG